MLTAKDIASSVSKLFWSHGLTPRTEYVLPNGRRLDVAAIGRNGDIAGAEIKISARDFRRDLKWSQYIHFCRAFYFAVPKDFPLEILPNELGIIVCTADQAHIVKGLTKQWRVQRTGLLRV